VIDDRLQTAPQSSASRVRRSGLDAEDIRLARVRALNRRKSIVLIAVMVLAGAPIGAFIGEAIEAATKQQLAMWPAVLGAMVGLGVSALLAQWTYFHAVRAIITMSDCHQVKYRDDPELLALVDEVRLLAGTYMPRVYILDDTAMNAFSIGRTPQATRLVLTAGLRASMPRDEMRAVIAHEMAHIRAGDTQFLTLICTMVGLLCLVADKTRRVAFHIGRGTKMSTDFAKYSGAAALVWGGSFAVSAVLFVLTPALGWLIQAIVSRDREHVADAEAARIIADPACVARALARLGADPNPLVDVSNRATAHLYIINPLEPMRTTSQGWDSFLCSHPPLAKRLERLAAMPRKA